MNLKNREWLWALVLVLLAAGLLGRHTLKDLVMSEQIENLKVYISVKPRLPDPANIETSGQWYVLGHISSSLAEFDHIDGKFKSLLADYEIFSSGVHSFTIKDGVRFSDGTPIKAQDVVASIKRLLIRKTSTHFPLWDYLENCDHLVNLQDDCSGIRAVSEKRVDIRLKRDAESFMLQMSSPETGIWSASDIDETTLEIKPTKYSGPYSISKLDTSGFQLSKNKNNPISKQFPHSPNSIQIKAIPSDKAMSELENGGVDVLVRSHNPYERISAEKIGIEIFSSAPSTLLYLHGAGKNSRNFIPRKYIRNLWEQNSDRDIVMADNFLPFDPGISLTKEEFLNELPEDANPSHPVVKIGVPWTYLTKEFYNFLTSAAENSGIKIECIELNSEEWGEAQDKGTAPHDIDFILGVYAASERYPAVQLRYITGDVRGPKIDLKEAETPDLSNSKKEILRDYQKALLKNEFAIPLFLARHQIKYKKDLNPGDQPPSDAEVELWRFTKK